METLVYVSILLFWGITLAVFFIMGYLVSGKGERPKFKMPRLSHKGQTDEELRELERLRKEYSNFLAYDGSEQEEIHL